MQIPAAKVHNRLSYWMDKAKEQPITVTRWGKPVGVIITPEEYEHLRRVRAYLQILRLSDSLQESDLTAEDLVRASREALEEHE